jgi:hypothetical protein
VGREDQLTGIGAGRAVACGKTTSNTEPWPTALCPAFRS